MQPFLLCHFYGIFKLINTDAPVDFRVFSGKALLFSILAKSSPDLYNCR
ncbi:MAG: hypothetical protein AAB264_02835 [Planctomycetota bacterium]